MRALGLTLCGLVTRLITVFKQTTQIHAQKPLSLCLPLSSLERRCFPQRAADPSGIWWSTPYADWADRAMCKAIASQPCTAVRPSRSTVVCTWPAFTQSRASTTAASRHKHFQSIIAKVPSMVVEDPASAALPYRRQRRARRSLKTIVGEEVEDIGLGRGDVRVRSQHLCCRE